MSGSLVLGLINGLTYALVAIGLVLIFKASRIVNVAHAQLGVLSALLLAKFSLSLGWPYWIAFPVAIAVGALLGALIEMSVIRRLSRRSPMSALLGTIGLAQILLALTFVKLVQPNPSALVKRGYPVPFDVQIHVGDFVLRGQHVLVLVVAPVVVISLAVVLRATLFGKALRAVAGNPDLARVAGIPARRVSSAAWAIAGALSAVTAILQAPAQATFSVQALGPGLLLRALGAAAIAGFTSFPLALSAGVGLGVVEALALHATHRSGDAEAIVFAAILLGFLLRSRRTAVSDESVSIVLDDRPLRIPDEMRDRVWVRHRLGVLAGGGVLLALLAPSLPVLRGDSAHFYLSLVVIFAIVGVSLTILTGWAGQVSLGHFAFIGVGAYTAARLAPHGWTMPGIALVAGGTGAVLAVLIGLPALRLRGAALAVTSLGFAVASTSWLFSQTWFGQKGNAVVAPPLIRGLGTLDSQRSIYYVSVVTLAVVLVVARSLRGSTAGRLMLATRDNERSVAALGISPTAVKLGAFALSGFIASVAGVLWVGAWRSASISLLAPEQSFSLLAVPIIGGLGSLTGAVLGALWVFGIPFAFSSSPVVALLFPGFGLLVTQLVAPAGLMGLARSGIERLLDVFARGVKPVPPDVVLQVRDLSVAFGGIRALDSVSIDVGPGEIVGLIGSNGAGKTTLLNAVSGLVAPDAGSIVAFGTELRGLPPTMRAHVGVLRGFQDARLFPGLTVREAVQTALARRTRAGLVSSLLGAPWARRAEQHSSADADRIVARMGLGGYADTLTGDLSTGTRRICDLAMQVAAGAKLLLLDEPTAGVAQRDAEQFGPLLRTIRAELGCSILVIEHDLPLLLNLADRLYCLDGGRVIAEGTPTEVRDNPAVVAAYLGTDVVAIERSGQARRRKRPASSPARRGTKRASAVTLEPTTEVST